MKLKINNENIDYVLENEKTLMDVLISLSEELVKEEALITKVVVDGNEVQISDDKIKDMLVNEINEVEVFAQKKDDVIYELLFECQRLLNEVKKSLIEKKLEQKSEILEAFEWIKETVQTIGKTGYISSSECVTVLSSVDKMIGFINTVNGGGLEVSTLISVIDNLSNYIKAIKERIFSIKLPGPAEIENMIEDALKILPQVSESFQVGKDEEALDKIERVITVIEVLCNYLKRKIKDFSGEKEKEVTNLYEDLNSLLLQLLDAFENQDVVLIGDLFEYELSQRLKNFKLVVLGKSLN